MSVEVYDVAHCVTDEAMIVLDADARFCALVERDLPELRRMSVLDITYHADRSVNESSLQRLKACDRAFGIKKRYVRPRGTMVWVRNHVTIVRATTMRPVFHATVQDLGEAAPRLAEAELLPTARKLMRYVGTMQARYREEELSEIALIILLKVYLGEIAATKVSIMAACEATGAPVATSLRHLYRIEERGLLVRGGDCEDKRRVFLELTPAGRTRLLGCLETIARIDRQDA